VSATRIAALVPCLDVAATVDGVVRGALAHVESVVVVDDGSTDETARLAEAAGATVLRHAATRGKGAALRTGLEWLRSEGFTHAFSLDGDGQHLAAEMPALLRESAAHPGAIVIGARIRDGEVAGHRRFGNEFANWWVSLAAWQTFPDTQSGFRIYPVDATLRLGVRADRYEFESEVLILASRQGIDVRSVPVRVWDPPPGELVSHYDPWIDTVRIIFTVVPLLVTRWR